MEDKSPKGPLRGGGHSPKVRRALHVLALCPHLTQLHMQDPRSAGTECSNLYFLQKTGASKSLAHCSTTESSSVKTHVQIPSAAVASLDLHSFALFEGSFWPVLGKVHHEL